MYIFKTEIPIKINQSKACEIIGLAQPTLSNILNGKVACRKVVAFFKGFIKTIENSNVGYVWDWDETKLKGKKVCGVFQYEEYEKQDGTKGIKVRLSKFRSLDKLKDIEVSDSVKLLDGTYVDYEEYIERQDNPLSDFKDEMEISSDSLPF